MRGLILPWVGSVLLVLSGTGAVLAATLFSLGSAPVLFHALRIKDERSGKIGLPWRRGPSPAKAQG